MTGVSSAIERPPAARLLSLDTFRGMVMLLLLFGGAVPAWSEKILPGNPVLRWIGSQFDHVPWEGAHVWDLGLPCFLFMSGMAIPYAIASRRARRIGWMSISARVLRRSLILIALGLIIRSEAHSYTNFDFVHDVLPQIGLAVPFVFLISTQSVRVQIGLAAGILVGYWLLFLTHPVPVLDPELVAPAIPADWTHFTGLFAHWNRYGNFAADFDRWFLNLFPRPEPFVFDESGMATLNFVPAIVTMSAGAWAGQLIRSDSPAREKVRSLALAAAGCLGAGWVLGHTLCPIVKAIYTPSWTIFSAGWALAGVLALYWIVDLRAYRRWTYPFVVLGMNALFVYLSLHLLTPWLWTTITKHFGPMSFTLELLVVNALIWAGAAWLYRRRVALTA